MKNKKVVRSFLGVLSVLLMIACSSNQQYKEENINSEELEEAYQTAEGNALFTKVEDYIPDEYQSKIVNYPDNSNRKQTEDNLKRYKYILGKDETEENRSISNIVGVGADTESIILKSNTAYLFGKGEYYINDLTGEKLENVVLSGIGIEDTVLVGAIGIFDSDDIVVSNMSIFYEDNPSLEYSSIAFINTTGVLLENTGVFNSSNGVEFSASDGMISHCVLSDNENTNLYAYDKSSVSIKDSYIASCVYNGVYLEDSELNMIDSTVFGNGYAGIYSRKSIVEATDCEFGSNSVYGIQLKYSQLYINGVSFDNENSSADIYQNPYSKIRGRVNKSQTRINEPLMKSISTQTQFDDALRYIEDNNNVVLEIDAGEYTVGNIFQNKEDIFFKSKDPAGVKFNGYLAFASCYDISIIGISMEFSGNAYNGVELKDSYFVEFSDTAIISSKQNGFQISGSIADFNNVSVKNSSAVGIVAIDSIINIHDSLFENNGISGISGISSNINIVNTKSQNNSEQSGITLLDCNVNIKGSYFNKNGITGISSEAGKLKIEGSEAGNNKVSGLEIASGETKIIQTKIYGNIEKGIIMLKESKLTADKMFISESNVGLYIDGNADTKINASVMRKNSDKAIYIKNATKPSAVMITNSDILYSNYGVYAENSNIILSQINFSNIYNTAVYTDDNAVVDYSDINFGDNIANEF